MLGIDKDLQTIQRGIENKTSISTRIYERIKKIAKCKKKIEDNPTYPEEKRQLYRDLILKNKLGLKYDHKIQKIFKRKLRRSNISVKKFLLKRCVFWQKN